LVAVVAAPANGFWRVARGPDPLALPVPLDPEEANSPRAGNRFDSPVGRYSVLYFGTHLEACFAETLARLRPAPGLRDVVAREWRAIGFMDVGAVAADWRHRRLAVRARPQIDDPIFLDSEDPETLEELRDALAPTLASYGYSDLDIGLVRGPDKRVPRAISLWAFRQVEEDEGFRFCGVRYRSRLDSALECWAVFDDVPLEELEKRPISLAMPALQAIAKRYGLTMH
jgi:RES domain